jgi:hypothetical protein
MLEISELQNLDFSLGVHLSGAFTNFNPNYGPKQYQEFMSRPVSKQIYRCEQDEPAAFIRAIRTAEATAYTTSDGKRVGTSDLPVIYYFRKPGFSFGDTEFKEAYRRLPAWSEDGTQAYETLMFPTVMTYQLKILSWDKPTLDTITLIMGAHLYESYIFNLKYAIDGYDITPIQAEIRDHRQIRFEDESLPAEEGRLWVVGTEFEVHTQILMGEAVTIPESATIQFITCGFCLSPDGQTGEQFFDGCEE